MKVLISVLDNPDILLYYHRNLDKGGDIEHYCTILVGNDFYHALRQGGFYKRKERVCTY